MFPMLKHGKVEMDAKTVKASIDFERDNTSRKEKKEIDFVKLVKEYESLFPELSPTGEKLYINTGALTFWFYL